MVTILDFDILGTEEIEEDLLSELLENPAAAAAAAAVLGPLALATIAPPPLPMFPPQGLPQPSSGGAPGAGGGGGGSLPSAALAVCGRYVVHLIPYPCIQI